MPASHSVPLFMHASGFLRIECYGHPFFGTILIRYNHELAPAEEMYLCLAGEAVFRRENCPDISLGSGDIMEHSANQPHSMETLENPIMAYVVWRNEFGTKPVLTFEDAR